MTKNILKCQHKRVLIECIVVNMFNIFLSFYDECPTSYPHNFILWLYFLVLFLFISDVTYGLIKMWRNF